MYSPRVDGTAARQRTRVLSAWYTNHHLHEYLRSCHAIAVGIPAGRTSTITWPFEPRAMIDSFQRGVPRQDVREKLEIVTRPINSGYETKTLGREHARRLTRRMSSMSVPRPGPSSTSRILRRCPEVDDAPDCIHVERSHIPSNYCMSVILVIRSDSEKRSNLSKDLANLRARDKVSA